jgi:glycosyltransferase involved in cell wall biosynthesis
MRGLDKNKYHVELACAPNGRLIELVQSNGMPVRMFRYLVQPIHPVKDLITIFSLSQFLKKNPYHIIHTHNSKAGFIGRLAGKLSKTPIIVHTVHGFAFHDQETKWKKWLILNLERLAVRWCDIMIFISQPLIDWALRDRVVTRKEKIIKIYSGIELEKFIPAPDKERSRLKEMWGLKDDEAVIGMVSKLWEGKGHILLIQAFETILNRFPNVKLIIVGEGYLKGKLKNMVSSKGLDNNVLFTGFQDNVREVLACVDVAVLPSYFEGMGRVLLEAMAMEKPVVGTRVGGIPDLIEDRVNGFLVEPGNEIQLTEAILKILTEKKLAKQLGANGRRKIESRYSAAYMVQAIETVYRRLLNEKGFQHAA